MKTKSIPATPKECHLKIQMLLRKGKRSVWLGPPALRRIIPPVQEGTYIIQIVMRRYSLYRQRVFGLHLQQRFLAQGAPLLRGLSQLDLGVIHFRILMPFAPHHQFEKKTKGLLTGATSCLNPRDILSKEMGLRSHRSHNNSQLYG